jgi:hypothetical protein
VIHGAQADELADTDDSPVDTARLLRDNAATFTILDQKLFHADIAEHKADGHAHPPPSPRDQLDAFLDATASDYRSAPPSHGAQTGQAAFLAGEEAARHAAMAENGDDISPSFMLDSAGDSADAPEYVPLARLPGHAGALGGGQQAKNKGKGDAGGEKVLTLDDLLDMEREGDQSV